MRSLYIAVTVAMVTTLSIALLVFVAISDRVERKYLSPVFEAMDELELESARNALNTEGSGGVSSYMRELNRLFGGSHYLLDSSGLDILSGENRVGLLPKASNSKSRGYLNGNFTVTHRSADGKYWFVAVGQHQTTRWTFFPYYLLVIGTTALLCWLVAAGIVSPIRKVTTTVERFGQGDLSIRVNLKRRDEIGALTRSFDEMADRLERMVISERRLLQDISHELRSPLARLKFSVKLSRNAANLKVALDRVERDVNRITSLVSEIVDMTRIEDDRLSRKEKLNLSELVDETACDCRLEAEFCGSVIRVEGQLSRAVSGDPELVRRAIENVLRNAMRYSPADMTIDVGLAESDSAATVTVRDYGPGVPIESLTKIFDPFFRVEEARGTDSGSVGLGLSIAKRAVQLHSGTITAENAFPGLRVQITIPYSQPGYSEAKDILLSAGSKP